MGESDRCYLSDMHSAEKGVARDVAERVRAWQDLEQRQHEKERVNNWVEKTEASGELSREQRSAVKEAATAPLLILTGGPGCGKTYTTRTIVKLWKAQGKKVLLAAPTGRAAQRLAEAAGLEAKTLHRLLECRPPHSRKKGGAATTVEEDLLTTFARNKDNPLEGQAIVVDECSMLDLPLAAALFAAVPKGAQLLLVGDVDQLPPVGPGQFLYDLINSKRVPVFRLNKVFRQAEQSAIVRSAHLVNQGVVPRLELANPNPKTDCLWEKTPGGDVEAALGRLLGPDGLLRKKGFNPQRDVQVLSPVKKGSVGTFELNTHLQALLNPPDDSKAQLEFRQSIFRVGDRVIQQVNDYDNEIFNGDLGTVTAVDSKERIVTVRFSSRAAGEEVSVSYGTAVGGDNAPLEELALAWAITVHKAQGSEYPAVILPLSARHGRMLSRKLLYTGLTRARGLVVVVGNGQPIEKAVKTVVEDFRYTHLLQRLCNLVPKAVGGQDGVEVDVGERTLSSEERNEEVYRSKYRTECEAMAA